MKSKYAIIYTNLNHYGCLYIFYEKMQYKSKLLSRDMKFSNSHLESRFHLNYSKFLNFETLASRPPSGKAPNL